MKGYLTPDMLANDARMRRGQVKNAIVLVEGDTDVRLFEQILAEGCHLIDCGGKDKVVAAIGKLNQPPLSGVVAIVDGDFDALERRPLRWASMARTDGHDIEVMLLSSRALDRVLTELGSREKREKFTAQNGDIRARLVASAGVLGLLRWHSLSQEINLKFEDLAFGQFLDDGSLNIDIARLIKVVKDKSQKPGLPPKLLEDGLHALEQPPDAWPHVCCGHDMVEILSHGLRKALGSCKPQDVTVERLGQALRLAFHLTEFQATALHQALADWSVVYPAYPILR